jgi:hypothetical protein
MIIYRCKVGPTLPVLIALLSLAACGDVSQKPKTIKTLYGEQFEALGEEVFWPLSKKPPSYVIEIPFSSDHTSDDLHALADKIFSGFAGPHASLMGFHSVAISPVSTDVSPGINLGVIKLGVSASAGPDNIYYRQNPDGTWSRDDGYSPEKPTLIQTYTLKNGLRYALTWAVEDFPNAELVYECLSCIGKDATEMVVENIYPMLSFIVVPYVNREKLRAADVVLFTSARKTLWDFPPNLALRLTKGSNGKWNGPIATTAQWKQLIAKQLRSYREQGAKMRGDRT